MDDAEQLKTRRLAILAHGSTLFRAPMLQASLKLSFMPGSYIYEGRDLQCNLGIQN